MRAKDLIKNAKIVKPQEVLNREITGIFYDSRKVLPGGIFVAIRGSSADGNAFVQDATEKGTAIIVTEKKDLVLPSNVGLVVVENARKALAEMAAIFYRFPSDKMTVIGVTGTKGKTSTSVITKKILEHACFKTGLVGTIQYEIGQRIIPSSNTTPESVDIQSLLAEMLENGLTHVVLEVSSHALDQGRVESINFDVGIFTNIAGHEHLDYHKNFKNYLFAKLKLFSHYLAESRKKNKYAIINIDNKYSKLFLDVARESNVNVVTFGLSKKADFSPDFFSFDRTGISFTLKGKKMHTRLLGIANLYNCLAAIATTNSLGIDLDAIADAIAKIENIPGRMEFVNAGQPFTVVVDYAHTHQALEELLKTVRHLNPRRLLVVFGCGGDRDKSKRPLMGKIAAKLADTVYITSDNPRNEVPEKIIQDIYKGVVFWRKKKCRIIPDRKQAISEAIMDAKEGDWVVIAGKGHEQYQIIKNVYYPFDDRKIAYEILMKKMEKM